ncbi:MAG: FISUMP domain-containing protein [Bacteroidales bacterium]
MKTTIKAFGMVVLWCTITLNSFGQNPKDNPPTHNVPPTSTGQDTTKPADTTSCGTFEYGGQVYHTIIIGTQCWMKENMNLGNWLDQSQNQTQQKNATVEKYCYGNDFINCDLWGGLYMWEEMLHYETTPGAQGICPSGWHVPDSKDWKQVIRFLGGTELAGGKMKSTGNRDWWVPNVGASNSSQFCAFPGGYFDFVTQTWNDVHNAAYFWSSESISTTTSVGLQLIRKGTEAELYEEYNPSALSLRCIRD